MKPTITLTITNDTLNLLAKREGMAVWEGSYQWGNYGLQGTIERALRDIPEWLQDNAPEWVSQWETASAQA